MKRRILLVLAVLLICSGLFVFIKFAANTILPKGKGGLQVTTNIKAQVFLNERPIGESPLCLCDSDDKPQNQTITAQDYNLRIVPDDKTVQPFVAKITVNPGVLTAVDRVFLPGALSSSYVLSLEKSDQSAPELFISSVPDGALITIDGQSSGVTPLDIKSISASEHDVEIQKPGFAKKTVRVRAVSDYKLVLNTVLGTQGPDDDSIVSTTPTSTQATPTPSGTPVVKVLIKDTPTGFLRVRATPSLTADEVGRVNPGESYIFDDENDEWYEITLTNGTKGWVSKSYASKQ